MYLLHQGCSPKCCLQGTESHPQLQRLAVRSGPLAPVHHLLLVRSLPCLRYVGDVRCKECPSWNSLIIAKAQQTLSSLALGHMTLPSVHMTNDGPFEPSTIFALIPSLFLPLVAAIVQLDIEFARKDFLRFSKLGHTPSMSS
jgi:hypothetical protein